MDSKAGPRVMAPTPAEVTRSKPSFASVAASAYIPSTSNNSSKNATTGTKSPPLQATPKQGVRNGHPDPRPNASDATHASYAAKAKAVAIKVQEPESAPVGATSSVEVSKRSTIVQSDEALTNPVTHDDNSTQVSSSEGSGKPPSLGGKSTLSAMTFAMDEKESLRPDDSASLRDVQEEESTSAPGSVVASSRVGSDTGSRAFRDQLLEISVMAPQYQAQAMANPSIAFGDGSIVRTNQPINEEHSVARNFAPSADNVALVPDEKLLEALESHKDRVWVLKCEQDIIGFVNNATETRLFLPPTNSFYRMLAHRMADYYLLGHQPDQTGSAVEMYKTPYTRLPVPLATIPLRSASLEAPQSTIPLRKIMRRGGERGTPGTNTASNSEGPSMTTSEAGGDSASEAGGEKKVLSREDREARYREARLRIFGTAEETESTDFSEPVSEDASRPGSTTGRKKANGKKQRSDDDDGFEARSAYNQYFGAPVTTEGYGSDGMYYVPYGTLSSPANPGYGQYPQMLPPQPQQGYGWSSQMYAVQPSPLQRVASSNSINYNLSADFQHGMQSFQSASYMPQHSPGVGSPPGSQMHSPYPAQTQPAAQWPAPQYDTGFQSGQNQLATQNTSPIPYAYGQLPAPAFQNGKPLANQHPIPGSFNRQHFNPQSQTFVPGNVSGPQYPVQQPPQGSYPSSMPQLMQATPMRVSTNPPPLQPYGTPPRQQGLPMHSPTPPSGLPRHPQQQQQQTPTAPNSTAPGSALPPQQHPLPQLPNPDSTIAKWGTPSHLPPKPPPPATMQPQRWLETHQRQMQQVQSFAGGNTAAAAAGLNAAAAGVARMGVGPGSGSGSPAGAAGKSGAGSPVGPGSPSAAAAK